MQTQTLSILSAQLTSLLPVLIVCLIGGVLGVMTWSKSRKAAALMLGGAALTVFGRVAWTAMYVVLVEGQNSGQVQVANMSRMLGIMGVASSIVSAIALAMIFVGAFVDRPHREKAFFIEDNS